MYGGDRRNHTPPDLFDEILGEQKQPIETKIETAIESEPELETQVENPPPHRFSDREPDAPLQYPTLFNADGTLSDRFRRIYETVERFNEEVAGELEAKMIEYVSASRLAGARRMDASVLSRLPSIPAKLAPDQYVRIVSEAASEREEQKPWRGGEMRFGWMFDAVFRVPLLYFKICVSRSDAVKAKHLEDLLRLGVHFDSKAIVTKAISCITQAIDDVLAQTSTLELSGEERAVLAKHVGNKMPNYWKKIKINHATKHTSIPPDLIGEEIDNLYSLVDALPGKASSVALQLKQKNELTRTENQYPVKVTVEKQCGCFMLVKVLEQRREKKYWMFSDDCANNTTRLCHVFVDGALLHGRYDVRASRHETRLSLNGPNNYVASVAATSDYGKSYQVIRADGVHFAIKLFFSKKRYESAKRTFRLVQSGFSKDTYKRYIMFAQLRNTLCVFNDPVEEKNIREWIADIDLPKVGDKILVMKSLKFSNPPPSLNHICAKNPERIYEMVQKVLILCAYFYIMHPEQNVIDWSIENFIWNHSGEIMLVDFEFRKEFTMHDVRSGVYNSRPLLNPYDFHVKYATLVACLNTCFTLTNYSSAEPESSRQYEMTTALLNSVQQVLQNKNATVKPVYKPNSRQVLSPIQKKVSGKNKIGAAILPPIQAKGDNEREKESGKRKIGVKILDAISDFITKWERIWGSSMGGGSDRNKGSGSSKLVCAGMLIFAMLAAAFVPT
jgi:hypothetical protein